MSAQKPIRELRVLSGPQSGARAKLPPGRYTLGSNESCDIVLRGIPDTSSQLLIEITEKTVHLIEANIALVFANGKPILTPSELNSNNIIRFVDSNIFIVIDFTDADWPAEDALIQVAPPVITESKEASKEIQEDEQEIIVIEETPTQQDTRSETAHQAVIEVSIPDDTLEQHDTAIKHVEVSMMPPPAKTSHRVARFAILIITVTGAVGWWSTNPPEWLTPSYASKAPHFGGENPLISVNSIIQQLKLSDKIRVTVSSEGALTIAGHVPTERDRQLLRQTVTGLPFPVEMLVFSDEGIASQAQRLLQTKNLPLRVTSVEAGRVQMMAEGPIAQSQFTEISESIMHDIKGVRSVDPLKLTTDDAIAGMHSLLEEYGLGRTVETTQEGNLLKLSGDLDTGDFERWEKLVQTFSQRFGDVVKFEANFNTTEHRLPFQILQILNGPIPAVVTDDGTRIFEGGEHQGYRLAEVRDHQLIFSSRKRKIEITF